MGSILIQGRLYSFDSSGPRHPDLGLRSWALGGITVPGTEWVDAQQEGSLRPSRSTKVMSSPAPALAKHRLSQSAALETPLCSMLEFGGSVSAVAAFVRQLQLLFISEHPAQCNEPVRAT